MKSTENIHQRWEKDKKLNISITKTLLGHHKKMENVFLKIYRFIFVITEWTRESIKLKNRIPG